MDFVPQQLSQLTDGGLLPPCMICLLWSQPPYAIHCQFLKHLYFSLAGVFPYCLVGFAPFFILEKVGLCKLFTRDGLL
jgi:hypothetical protein